MSETSRTVSLADIIATVGGEVVGDAPEVFADVAALADAGPEQVSFYANNTKYLPDLIATKAGLVLISGSVERPNGVACLVLDDPYAAWCDVLRLFYPAYNPEPGVDASASVDPSANLGDGVYIGPNVTIGADVVVGDRSRIDAGAVIERGAKIGADCHVMARAVLCFDCVIGDRVILQPGVVIGGDGFGFAITQSGMRKIPQVGIVSVGSDVEIGANTTIDRATFGKTKIGDGVKIDNLVQIGHNVEVGAFSAIVAQAGIAGSTKLGMGVQIGGQAGLAGHIEVGDMVQIGARAGIMKDTKSSTRWLGAPAVDPKQFFKIHTLLQRLPDIWKRLRRLEKRVDEMSEHA